MSGPFSKGDFWPTGETIRGRAKWCVTTPFSYQGRAGSFHIPDGFVFDGPSIPFWATPFLPVGQMFLPAALHDWLLFEAKLPKKVCDKAFHTAMIEVGTPRWVALVCYLAVRTRR